MFQIVSGTNRNPSQTLRVARVFHDLFLDAGADAEIMDLCDMPASIFNPSSYSKKPSEFVTQFSDKILASEGLLVVVPEYNGSFPGVLKYFIDMLKFPESFEKRPVAFVGLASGMWGALRAVEHLEAVFRYRNAFVFNERVFLPRVETQLNGENEFVMPLTGDLAQKQVTNFINFARAIRTAFGP
jgi:NAD(P)H-dependent FMN reductase